MRLAATLKGLLLVNRVIASSIPQVRDTTHDVTYEGLLRNGIELFLNIPYGQDTGGQNRFKPPRRHIPVPGTTVKAQAYGPSCPQPLGQGFVPVALGTITEVSENCLNLNVARPNGTRAKDRLPVMVWIHGGGFWSGGNNEPTTAPDGLVMESVENGLPVIHVAINYRLGCKILPIILPYQHMMSNKFGAVLLQSLVSRSQTLCRRRELRMRA